MSPLSVPQVVYGSASGRHDFRVLAASPEVSRDELDVVDRHSNLGGSAQTAENPPPLYAFYPLPSGRHAFSRTVFLGGGGRGNDYLAHVLVLSDEAMELLRGDLFLLAGDEAGIFRDAKPAAGDPLPALALDRGAVAERAVRPCGADVEASVPRSRLAGVLAALAAGTAVVEAGPAEGVALTRSVLSVLPPDDRRQSSFTTRFSYPRRSRFRLCVHVPEDAGLVDRYLARETPRGAGDVSAAAEAWLARVAGERETVEPVFALSWLDDPGRADRLTAGLGGWIAAAGTGRPHRPDDEVVAVARDPRNRRLPGIGSLFVEAVARDLVEKGEAVLAGGGSAEELARVIEAASAEAPVPALVERLRRSAEADGGAADDPAALGPPTHQTLALALALSRPDAVPPAELYSPRPGRALLAGEAEAAAFWARLTAAAPRIGLDLLGRWLEALRVARGEEALGLAIRLLPHARRRGGGELVRHLLAAVERAAPEPGTPEARRSWLLAALRGGREVLGGELPTLTVARWVAREELLAHLAPAELEWLAPPLVETFPQLLNERLSAGGDLGGPRVLGALLGACERGLAGGWGLDERPERWELASRVVDAVAARPGSPESPERGETWTDAAWLLWAASRQVDRGGGPAGGQPELDRFAGALDRLVEMAPEGVADVVLRVVYRFVRFGPGYAPQVAPEAWTRLRRRALDDADRGGAGAFRLGTRARVAWLDAGLLAGGNPAASNP